MPHRLLAVLLGLIAVVALVLFVSVLADYGDNIKIVPMAILLIVMLGAAYGAFTLWRRPRPAP